MRKLYIFGFIALAAVIIGLAWADQMTFTTYYPAPYGVYNNMRVMDRLGVGTTQPEAKLDVAGDGEAILVPRKSDAGDPSGTNGMVYYNSDANKFRVYENGEWKNFVAGADYKAYLVENNMRQTLSSNSWTNYMTETITVDKDDSNVLFIFSFSQPFEGGAPDAVWRVGLDGTYSNAKYRRYATTNWLVLPGGMSFLMTGVNAGTYTARLQYKFYRGQWRMSDRYQSEAYNSLIIIVL